MIRVVAGMLMMRSIERGRPLPRWLAAAAKRSRSLRELEARLRLSHGRLSGSVAGVIAPPPANLAARTVASLPAAARARPARGRRIWPAAALAGIGAVAAVAAVVVIVLPQPNPTSSPRPDAPPGHIAAIPEAPAPRALITALQTTPDELAAGALSGGLLAEAQRLRDDTRAAAGYVLSRIRLLGGVGAEPDPQSQTGG